MNIGSILIFFSMITSFLSLISAIIFTTSKKWNNLTKIATERLFYLSGISIIFAVILLFMAFLTHSFNFNYVYNYSSKDLSTVYLITAFWAGQEGTLLLWVFLLYIFGFFIIRSKDSNWGIIIAVITITQIFILIILSVYSPFRYIWDVHPGHFRPGIIPPDGSGLNPLLQNPWMVIHPPVLFVGYASATIPFAYAIAALIKNDYKTWITRAYRWVLFCMTSLGIGIFLGGYWAYVVLGWGGYWGWDPVENSSLIPWLILVALMHGLIIQRRKNALIKTNIFLALISHIFVFYSTFLTRSGILSDFSVHSFGDLGISGYLIFSIAFFILISTFLFIIRFRYVESPPLSDKILNAENIINYGIITLLFYSLFILIGTSMPVLSKIFMLKPTSVKAGFYNSISIPFGVLILLFIVLAATYQFPKINKKNIIITFIMSIILTILLNMLQIKNFIAYIFTFCGSFVIIHSIADLFKNKANLIPSRLAHLGVGIFVVGIVTSNIHSSTIQKILPKNIEVEIQSVKLMFKGIKETAKSSLIFTYKEGNTQKDIETKYFINRKTNSLYREPYIDYCLLRDVYISPIEYQSGAEKNRNITLVKDEEKEIDGMKIKFIGFAIKKEHMTTNRPELFVKLSINIGGKSYIISPGVRIKGGVREAIDANVPNTERRISLQNFDIRRKSIILFVEPDEESSLTPDSVLIEISFKRLIWFVWLGTVLISIGCFFAIRRSSRRAGN